MEGSSNSEFLVARGQRAEAFMATEMFSLLIRDVEQDIISESLGSEPHEVKKREGLYQKHQGLKGLVETLNSYIEIGLAEQERLESLED